VIRQKLIVTMLWSAMCIAGAMCADFVITILLFDDHAGYTPFITLCVATVVAVPVTYLLVSSRFDLSAARDELAKARDAAVSANRSKTLFFANMSHELRTPLNAVIGFSQLLEADVFESRRVEYARLIQNAGRHLLDLVNDLLDLSRIEAGKFSLNDEDVLLAGLMDECCDIVAPRLRSGKLRLSKQITEDAPVVWGDHRALKQIVLNLLTNAIKFSPAGGVIEVFVSWSSSGELTFGVRDEGIGIARDDQDRIFERYGRARHEVALAQEGTGLGLPIVKGLVEAHDGRVTLESTLGLGTCVTVWLPRSRVRVSEPKALAS
jgi:two-component system cell cycle sensor histidine kinase PleC